MKLLSKSFVLIVGSVALFTRAWIEIQIQCTDEYTSAVALFTRAWIEIQSEMEALDAVPWSPSLRGRGLKSSSLQDFFNVVSRPLYEGVD